MKILFSLVSVLMLATSASAALPDVVDGKPLPSLAPLIARVTPAVVNIATSGRVQSPLSRDPFFGFLRQQPRYRNFNSLGSGVIVDARQGYILTNHHVIEHADRIRIGLHDGREVDAILLGSDPETDIALLRVEAPDLSALPIADSDQLRQGDFVIAIGNPFSLGHSVTSGIVSALGRQGLGIEEYEDFIQTDAAINPGNSGGALINLAGELVGINTAIVGREGNVGIGFAIPSNLARQRMQQLLKFGQVRRGDLGFSGDNLTPRLAEAFGIRQTWGVVVTEVNPGSPAEAAGLEQADIITAINGRKVRTVGALRNQLGLLVPNAKITLTVVRGEQELELDAVLSEPVYTALPGEELHPYLAGSRLQIRNRANGEQEVLVASLTADSRAAYWGLRPGDILLGAGRYLARNLDQLQDIIDKRDPVLALNIRRQGRARVVIIR